MPPCLQVIGKIKLAASKLSLEESTSDDTSGAEQHNSVSASNTNCVQVIDVEVSPTVDRSVRGLLDSNQDDIEDKDVEEEDREKGEEGKEEEDEKRERKDKKRGRDEDEERELEEGREGNDGGKKKTNKEPEGAGNLVCEEQQLLMLGEATKWLEHAQHSLRVFTQDRMHSKDSHTRSPDQQTRAHDDHMRSTTGSFVRFMNCI